MTLLSTDATDLKIRRGDSPYLEGRVTRPAVPPATGRVGVDLSGKVLRFMARTSRTATGAAVLDKSSADGEITFGTAAYPAAEGGYRIAILPADTAAIDAPVRLVYDVELDEAGVITTVAHGRLYIDADVTR